MTLEATVLVLDNSQYSINGDFPPTRYSAQSDAVHILFNAKLNANPENEVGLMVMGGKAPEVLVTPTQDEGKLIAALHETKQGGEIDLSTGIQVAQLALKHRQNKNQRQRIIVFVGSPLKESQASLVKLGKKMKKNNVAIDIISFGNDSLPSSSTTTEGTTETNESKLQALHEAVNSSDNSHYLAIEPGPYLLSEKIAQSAILRGEGAEEGGGGNEEYGGIDPNMDPELAMALRMSMEEEQARQAALANASSTPAADAASSSTLAPVPESAAAAGVKIETGPAPTTVETTPLVGGAGAPGVDVDIPQAEAHGEEDDDLARALALSRGDGDVEMEMDEDEEMARAIALSMKEAEEEEKK
ncbi:26S proteasome regulatory subunit N10 [Pseudohyphozyma bogoriensis]|nr:26S proteasome regulatory subunit N10 [Pseudohyphozyma bogoriensis]